MRSSFITWLYAALILSVTALEESTDAMTTKSDKPVNKLYLIRHGEKPADEDQLTLSAKGQQRAECIKDFFSNAPFHIKHILAMKPVQKQDGLHRQRAQKTVETLAGKLGLEVDVHCDRDDIKCAVDSIHEKLKDGDVLLCWEHKVLADIVKGLGDTKGTKYPKARFDLVWEYSASNSFKEPLTTFSENCLGLDRDKRD